VHKINGHRPVDFLYQLGQVYDRLFNHSVHLSRKTPTIKEWLIVSEGSGVALT
jgi:hypothetical protein